MNPAVWMLVVFIEGFASLGVEVIALRRLVPHLGSSITVTAPTIGLFLAALALGYWSGGRVPSGFGARVLRNFLLAALIAGVGLSSVVVNALFGWIADPVAAYLLFMALVVCPPAWLLAQTVPLLTNVLPHERAGAASGAALTASTAGSVLGATVLALVVMQWYSVSAAVVLCAAALAAVVPVTAAAAERTRAGLLAALTLLAVLALNLLPQAPNAHETAYADYRTSVQPPLLAEANRTAPESTLFINNQRASRVDASDPRKGAPYVERLRELLRRDLALHGRRILVLGAGGFTLSIGDAQNHYTYVDVDPAIRAIAENDLLHAPIEGDFIADDARRFVTSTPRRFDAIVVDVYSSHAAVPAHLVTLEFWRSLRRPLADGGTVLVNLILDSRLASAFARNLLATLEQGLGRCGVEVQNRAQRISNVLVVCQPDSDSAPPPVRIYSDERNRVELDRGILGY